MYSTSHSICYLIILKLRTSHSNCYLIVLKLLTSYSSCYLIFSGYVHHTQAAILPSSSYVHYTQTAVLSSSGSAHHTQLLSYHPYAITLTLAIVLDVLSRETSSCHAPPPPRGVLLSYTILKDVKYPPLSEGRKVGLDFFFNRPIFFIVLTYFFLFEEVILPLYFFINSFLILSDSLI